MPTPPNDAKVSDKIAEVLTKWHGRGIVACQTRGGPGIITASGDKGPRRLSRQEWRYLVELLSELHPDDLGSALLVIRLWGRSGEQNGTDGVA